MISSTTNKQVKFVNALVKKAKTRREEDLFVAEGLRMCSEIPKDRIHTLYLSESFSKTKEGKALREGVKHIELVTDEVFKNLSDTQTPQGILALVKQYHYTLEEVAGGSRKSAQAEDLQEKYPERKIVVIDTLCASLGEGLIDYKALELQKEGKSLEEVAQWVEENKLKICHFFMVEDLNHLQKGGRISKTAAVLGTMVQIKPIIYLDNEGKLQIIKKERGRKKAMNKIVDMAIDACEGKMPDMVMIPHGNCPKDAEYVAELVRKKMGVTNIMMNDIGTVIGGHTGPGMVAVVCMGVHR